MHSRRLFPALALAALAAAACSKEVGTNAESKQTVGAKIDRALDTTQRSLERAGEKAKEEIAEASEKTQETLSKAGERISATTTKVVDDAKDGSKPQGPAGGDAAAGAPPTTTATVSSGPTTSIKATGLATNAREKLNDAAITASIKADFLKDPDLSVLKIDVDTRDGVVTLNGLADNEPAKQRAERMAEAVKGVREVRNYLTIKRG